MPKLRLSGVTVHENELFGVMVKAGHITLTKCQILNTKKKQGVHIDSGASADLTDQCIIDGNHLSGVAVGGIAILKDCTIRNNGGWGVELLGEGRVNAEDCRAAGCYDNTRGDWPNPGPNFTAPKP